MRNDVLPTLHYDNNLFLLPTPHKFPDSVPYFVQYSQYGKGDENDEDTKHIGDVEFRGGISLDLRSGLLPRTF